MEGLIDISLKVFTKHDRTHPFSCWESIRGLLMISKKAEMENGNNYNEERTYHHFTIKSEEAKRESINYQS